MIGPALPGEPMRCEIATEWLGSDCEFGFDDKQRVARKLPPAKECEVRDRWGRAAGRANRESGASGRQIDPSHAVYGYEIQTGGVRGRRPQAAGDGSAAEHP